MQGWLGYNNGKPWSKAFISDELETLRYNTQYFILNAFYYALFVCFYDCNISFGWVLVKSLPVSLLCLLLQLYLMDL